MSCAICHLRREKRFCLALHGRICPQCCGEQREVTLDCPAECPYLQQARLHERPRASQELPPDAQFPQVSITEQFLHEREPVIAGILQTLGKMALADRSLNDREIIGALTNMAKSYQVLAGSGLVYQEALPSLVQQSVIDDLRRLLEEFREVEHQHLGHTTLRDGDVLRALVFTLRLAQAHTSGRPRSRAFLDLLHERFPETTAPATASGQPAGRIILP